MVHRRRHALQFDQKHELHALDIDPEPLRPAFEFGACARLVADQVEHERFAVA
jgi:hypothetical protein